MENTNTSDQESNQSQAPSNNTNTVINQEALPNSTAILVLGISSIAITLCCCVILGAFGFIGILLGGILSAIALIMAKKAKNTYEQNPELYTESSFNNTNAGRICAIVGLVLAGLCLIILTIVILIYGAAIFASMPNNNFY
jgi:hypothetical protein